MLGALTLPELKERLRCSQCGGRDVDIKPHRQQDAQGYAKGF